MTYHVKFINNENCFFQVSKNRDTMSEAYRDYEAISKVITESHLMLVRVEETLVPAVKPEEEELPF